MEPSDANLDFTEYYNQVVEDTPNYEAMFLEGEDAIAFLMGMGDLRLDGTEIKTGKDLIGYVLAAAPNIPQILLPHGKVIVYFTIDNQVPTAIITSNPLRMQSVLKNIGDTIIPKTWEVMDALIAQYKLTHN
jgi:hypothetical protein